MRFGLMLPSYSFPDLDYDKAGRLREFSTRAEAMGFETLWVAEHLLTARGLYGTAWLSPLETLGFAAGATTRIKIATGILIPPIRNPVFMAKEIASLHVLSGGRFELGVGVGWDAQEFRVAGVKLSERGGRTDEILDIFAKLWRGEEVTHTGRYYRFENVAIGPPLRSPPPIWVAGGSKVKTDLSPDPETIAPTVLERICRRADGWLARAAGTNASVIADWAQITRRLDEIGRARGSLLFGHLNFAHIVPTDDRAAALQGAAAALRADHGDAPLVRAPAGVLPDGHRSGYARPRRRAGGGRAGISGAVAARLRAGAARSMGGGAAPLFPLVAGGELLGRLVDRAVVHVGKWRDEEAIKPRPAPRSAFADGVVRIADER